MWLRLISRDLLKGFFLKKAGGLWFMFLSRLLKKKNPWIANSISVKLGPFWCACLMRSCFIFILPFSLFKRSVTRKLTTEYWIRTCVCVCLSANGLSFALSSCRSWRHWTETGTAANTNWDTNWNKPLTWCLAAADGAGGEENKRRKEEEEGGNGWRGKGVGWKALRNWPTLKRP